MLTQNSILRLWKLEDIVKLYKEKCMLKEPHGQLPEPLLRPSRPHNLKKNPHNFPFHTTLFVKIFQLSALDNQLVFFA